MTALCSLNATPALADEIPETVVVTATRTAQPLAVTGTSMSVITADDLKLQQIDAVTDILAETPGLTVVRNGGPGQNANILMRGAEAGQTLVLIDGVRINDPSATSGYAILGDVLANNIERIEVLRGPQSTLYGSDAIGGVVNILTRRGGGAPFAATASAEGGSFDTFHVNAAANGTASAIEYGAALNYFDTGGVSAADARNGNREVDGYRNFGATANVRVLIADNLSADLRGYYTSGRDEFDDNFVFVPPASFLPGDSAAYNTNELVAGYAGIDLDLFGGMLRNRLALTATASTRDFFDSAFDTIHKNSDDFGNALRVEYQGIVELSPTAEITFGAEMQRVSFRGDSFASYAPPDTASGHSRIAGYYLQAQKTFFSQLTLTGGVRLDDDAEFGTHTSLKFAGAWRIPGWNTTLRANYGDGFKAPSLYEDFSQYSNPFHALAPESARGWEVGADHELLDGHLRASLTYFERRTTDQIDFLTLDCFTPPIPDVCNIRPYGYYENLKRTRASGVEAEIVARLSDTVSASADYTHLSATDLTTGLTLARRPRDSASATLFWLPLPKLTLGGSLIHVGPRFDDAADRSALASNTTVNLFGSYALTEKLEVFARTENLFDELNEPVLGYGRVGRAVHGGVRVAF